MRKAIFIALAATSVSLFANPNISASTSNCNATAAIYLPISISPVNCDGTVKFGSYVSDGSDVKLVMDAMGIVTAPTSNVTALPFSKTQAATFNVKSDAGLLFSVAYSGNFGNGPKSNVTFIPQVACIVPQFKGTAGNSVNTPLNVFGELDIKSGTYGSQLTAPFSVTVCYQ